MSITYKPLPKHKKGDIIDADEWNIISDDLEWLKQKIEEGAGAPAEVPPLLYVRSWYVYYCRGYLVIFPWLSHGDFDCPASWDNDRVAMWGAIANRSYTLRKLKVFIPYVGGLPDGEIYVGVAVNGVASDLRVTIPTTISEGDIYEDNVHEVNVSEGDRVTMYIDQRAVSTGDFQMYIQMEYV